MRNRPLLCGAITAAALLIAGCQTGTGTKAGGNPAPVTLKVAEINADAKQFDNFVAQVTRRSHDTVHITVDTDWHPSKTDSTADQELISKVASGDYDLGLVGTRAFAEVGDNSFAALTAPMLIDSYALQQAVVDSTMPARMLKTLAPLKVTGLALWGGPLRRPIGVRGPLLNPSDWRGISFQAWHSAESAKAVAALGATPNDDAGNSRDAGLGDGSINGYETNMAIYGGRVGSAPYLTLNEPLWPLTRVLLANPKALSRLSESQRSAVMTAATDGAPTARELFNADADLVPRTCNSGGRIALASQTDRKAMANAVAPAITALKVNPTTSAYIDQIAKLKSTTPGDAAFTVPAGCTGAAPARADVIALTNYAGDTSPINGVYRVTFTVNELMAGGFSRDDGEHNDGVITLTFKDGRFVQSWVGADNCLGTYTLSATRISMLAAPGPEWGCDADNAGQPVLDAAWHVRGGKLTFSDFVLSKEFGISWAFKVFDGSKPLTKAQ
jgi:TRAP-type C4-dicarboxylate transport system substrate-binding protein